MQQEFDPINYERQCTMFMAAYGGLKKHDIDIDYPHMSHEDQIKLVTEINSITTKEQLFNSFLFIKNKNKHEETVEKLSVGNKNSEGPPCPRCKSKMFSITMQRNSCDEAMKNELHCPTCTLIKFE